MIDEDRFAGELGYQVVPWARGRGVAAAAARLVRDWGLDELGLERLEIHADADNIGSQRVALALGHAPRGTLRGYLSARGVRRDYVLLAMRASDPRERVVPLPEPRLSDGFVVVRPLEPDDAPAVAAACQDPLIQERCYFVPVAVHASRTRRASSPSRAASSSPAPASTAPSAPPSRRAAAGASGSVRRRRAPRRHQPDGLPGTRGRRDRLLGQARGARPRRRHGRAPSHDRLRLRAGRRRAPRAHDRDAQRAPRSASRRSSASGARASPAPTSPRAGSATGTWSTRPTAASTRSSTRSCAPSGRRSPASAERRVRHSGATVTTWHAGRRQLHGRRPARARRSGTAAARAFLHAPRQRSGRDDRLGDHEADDKPHGHQHRRYQHRAVR